MIDPPAVPLVERTRNSTDKRWLESFAPIAVNVIDPNVAVLAETNLDRVQTLAGAIDLTVIEYFFNGGLLSF